jgi:hypothetical protein
MMSGPRPVASARSDDAASPFVGVRLRLIEVCMAIEIEEPIPATPPQRQQASEYDAAIPTEHHGKSPVFKTWSIALASLGV